MSMTEYPCNECGLPGVNRVFDGGGTAYIHHRCPAKTCFLCGQMEITDMVGHLCPKIEEKDMATANTPETCPCANWSWVVGEYHDRTKHHPNCDGHGKPKTQFVTGMSVAEPSLSWNRRKGDKYERLRGIIKQLEQEIEALTQV